MNSDSKDSKKKRTVGFNYAARGLKKTALTERNFQIQLCAAALTLIVAALLQLSAVEWIIIIMVIGLVLALEVVNTAIERLLDYLSPEFHPLAGAVKDISAGAVLLAVIVALLVAMIIFLPKINAFLFYI
ncbi:diacylglycerol kinase family protein [Sediminibacillus albus]|uniref:Undecaprenol kinase/diacylglycerol kinase (ATP) n=1 Tax=Sediminibacillus albus TaxID=407036 RepID=A0A1G9CQ42_9BACI|nr:diacylglycerol kinase family protein [Sediminibacillus albus]SDK53728.1 undecaprenol kinase/diacylglycerol kinase (ATP) [Sediminibacillus albus]